ncbi:MAG: cbb3-type cytochrome c oxidase N-terminal domain-containing protein [Flavobacterium sp.]
MRKLIPSYVRVPLIFAVVMGAMEYFIDSGDKPAFIEYPMVALFLGVFLFLLVAIEIVVSAVDKITYSMLTDEQRKKLEEAQSVPFTESKFYLYWSQRLTRSKEIEEEADVMLDHDYDGIKELDNVLPPWWVALFYITIIFGVVYLIRFHVINEYDQASEFEREMELAQAEIDKYKLSSPDVFDINNMELLTDAESLNIGKTLFNNQCAACHREDMGGAIGPNLVDEYWVLGGSLKDIYNTIAEGGREGKGMIPWKTTLKPAQMQKLASYIISMQGTNPPDAKAPEGEKYVMEVAAETAEPTVDSLQVTQ